jgi:hypothetical protein
MPLGGLVLAGIGAATGIVKGISDISRSKKIKPAEYKPFEISQGARRMQGLAQAQLNARVPGAAAQQRGLLASQAGAMAGTQRAAQSSSQALAAAAGLQAGTNQAMAEQAMQEQQMYQQRLATLFGAEQNLQQQEGMKWELDETKRLQDVQMKEAMRNAGWQSIVGGVQNAATSMIAGSEFLPGRGAPSADMVDIPRLTQGMATSQASSLFPQRMSPQSAYSMGTMAQLPSALRPQAPGRSFGVGLSSLPGILQATRRPDVNTLLRR